MKKGISKTVLKMITTRDRKCDIGTPVSDAILELLKKRQVTIGFRESCGCTDSTAKEYGMFNEVIIRLRKEGFKIKEGQGVKQKNKSPTSAGGFWREVIFYLED